MNQLFQPHGSVPHNNLGRHLLEESFFGVNSANFIAKITFKLQQLLKLVYIVVRSICIFNCYSAALVVAAEAAELAAAAAAVAVLSISIANIC